MRAAVIGAGVIGCSVGFELARRGVEVTLIDKHGEVGHGSTSASCAIVRRFYSQPGMIAMAHEGASIWANLEEHLGPINEEYAQFKRPGMLLFLSKIDDTVKQIVAEMRKVGVGVDLMDAHEAKRRFPYFDLQSHNPVSDPDAPDFFQESGKEVEGVVFEHDAGYVVSPGLATHNIRLAAEREGATFLMRQTIKKIARGGTRRFQLTCEGGERIDVDVLVNAAGPYSAHINRMAGVVLPLETRALRREVHAVRNPVSGQVLPTLPVVGDLDGGVYFRPEGGAKNIVVGSTDPPCDRLDWVDDPDDYVEHLTEAYHRRQTLRLMKRLPSVRFGPRKGVAALYDVTVKDWYPIVDKTDEAGYYVCIGTSGSSFKTSLVLGQLLAETISANEAGQDTDVRPIDFRLTRVGLTVRPSFLSRSRGTLSTTSTVIG